MTHIIDPSGPATDPHTAAPLDDPAVPVEPVAAPEPLVSDLPAENTTASAVEPAGRGGGGLPAWPTLALLGGIAALLAAAAYAALGVRGVAGLVIVGVIVFALRMLWRSGKAVGALIGGGVLAGLLRKLPGLRGLTNRRGTRQRGAGGGRSSRFGSIGLGRGRGTGAGGRGAGRAGRHAAGGGRSGAGGGRAGGALKRGLARLGGGRSGGAGRSAAGGRGAGGGRGRGGAGRGGGFPPRAGGMRLGSRGSGPRGGGSGAGGRGAGGRGTGAGGGQRKRSWMPSRAGWQRVGRALKAAYRADKAMGHRMEARLRRGVAATARGVRSAWRTSRGQGFRAAWQKARAEHGRGARSMALACAAVCMAGLRRAGRFVKEMLDRLDASFEAGVQRATAAVLAWGKRALIWAQKAVTRWARARWESFRTRVLRRPARPEPATGPESSSPAGNDASSTGDDASDRPADTTPAAPAALAGGRWPTRETASAPAAGRVPADLPELAAYLDRDAEDALSLTDRGQRLTTYARSDLRLTPRLREAIGDAATACALAAEAVSGLPAKLRADLDV